MERIWEKVLEKAGTRFQLPVGEVKKFIKEYPLSPGHISQAVTSWKRVTKRKKPNQSVLGQFLGQSLHLCAGRMPQIKKLRNLDIRYDPSMVQVGGGFNVGELVEMLKVFYQFQKKGLADTPHQLTLLFHGRSGSGKTELAKYLADQCGHPLQVERMSDILSPWVGISEKNLSSAFLRAQTEGNLLLLDEFDSLGYNRTLAKRSWEVSQTNELLQQIENFPGVLIACTNLLENLDQAIPRRFSHKINFFGDTAQFESSGGSKLFWGLAERKGAG